jgi:hypothetical protein
VVDLLQQHRVRQLEARLLLGLGRNEGGLVFTQLSGEAVAPDNFTKEFGRLVKRAGVRS